MRASRRHLAVPSRSCARIREALSAQHDQEPLPSAITPARVREHVSGCAACARFAAGLRALDQQVATAAASPSGQPSPGQPSPGQPSLGDALADAGTPAATSLAGPGSSPALTSRILTSLAEADAARRHVLSVVQLRWLVAFAGAVQLALAVPVLFGAVGPGFHAGRELGSLQLAIGVGLIVAAMQPMRAAGVLPIVGVVTALTVVIAAIDVAAGVASLGGELVHVSELVGLAALWALARRTPIAVSPARRLSPS